MYMYALLSGTILLCVGDDGEGGGASSALHSKYMQL